MIDVFDLYERFCGKVNTHQGGHARPHRNFLNWVRDINVTLFKEYYKVFEKTQNVSDVLTPFLRSRNVVITGRPGQMHDLIRKPADYERLAHIRIYYRGGITLGKRGLDTCNCEGQPTECPAYVDDDLQEMLQANADAELKEITAEKLDNGRWGALAARVSKKASVTNPKVTQYDEGLKILPKGLGVVILDYFRLPATPTMNYTIIDEGLETERIQYNRATSQPLEWSETLIDEILSRLEIAYGVHSRNQLVLAQGERNKAAAE
jgi:hypothetical protein